MPNYIAVEEQPTHYKTFLHWDDGEEPFVTVFTDMAMTDTQEMLPRLERMFSWMVFPQALITNWDRSGELLSDVSDSQLPLGLELGYLVSMLEQWQCAQHRMRTVRRRIYAAHLTVCRGIIEQLEQVEIDAFPTAFVTFVTYLHQMASDDSVSVPVTHREASEVESSYRAAIRSVNTFKGVLQRSIQGVAYSTRTIDPGLDKVFWAAGVRSFELEVELEHWQLVQTQLKERCGANQARRVARSIVSGNTAISAMADAASIAQQTNLSEEDVTEALRQASEDAETSSEEEDGTNGFNANGHHDGAHGSPMDADA